jgi:hypothetical protein
MKNDEIFLDEPEIQKKMNILDYLLVVEEYHLDNNMDMVDEEYMNQKEDTEQNNNFDMIDEEYKNE